MITISLNQIRDQSPCETGWKKLLQAKGGKKSDMDAQFPLAEVIETNNLDDTLWCLRCRPEYSNLWRKYAVWCARQVQHLMADQRSLDVLDVAWRHSEGQASDSELAAAGDAAGDAAWAAAWDAAWAAAGDAAGAAARAAARAAAGAAARAAQKVKLLQILTVGEWVDKSVAQHKTT